MYIGLRYYATIYNKLSVYTGKTNVKKFSFVYPNILEKIWKFVHNFTYFKYQYFNVLSLN